MKRTNGETQISDKGSPPARGAWIETLKMCLVAMDDNVAPCAGGVD